MTSLAPASAALVLRREHRVVLVSRVVAAIAAPVALAIAAFSMTSLGL